MQIQATIRSATYTGMWSALGIIPFEWWIDHHKNFHVLLSNALWLVAIAAFFFIPFYFFVIGQDAGPFTRLWFLDRTQRQAYFVVVKRMLYWFLGAASFGAIWSIALSFILKL
jgi:hypothetical protein